MEQSNRFPPGRGHAAHRFLPALVALLAWAPSLLSAQTAPTISAIADQVVNVNTATDPIAFTIGDVETDVSALTLSAASSDTTLVPVANIQFGGSDANRTVTITPGTDATGTATISIVVTDGDDQSATNSFELTVNALPTISSIADQTASGNTDVSVDFTVGDAETPAEDLTLAATSSDTGIVPNENIVFGGGGTDRTVTITPTTDVTGETTITVTVEDANGATASTEFTVSFTLGVSFDPPTLDEISDKDTSQPFAGLVLDAGNPVTNVITFPDERGTFPEGSGLTKSLDGANAVYTLEALSPASAKVFLTSLVFTPTENRIPIGESETTTFRLTATDATGSAVGTVDLTVSASNDPPVVSFTSTPDGIDDKHTALPFADIEIEDVDAGDSVVVKIQFPDVRGALPVSESDGFTKTVSDTNAVYTLTSRSASDAQAYVRALVYTPVENRIPIGETEVTTFIVTATDLLPASATNTVDLEVTPVNDPPRIFGSIVDLIGDNTNALLFAGFTIEEVDVARINGIVTNQHVTVTITNSLAPGGGAPVYGAFQDVGPDATHFSLTENAAALTEILTNLVFEPVANLQPVGESNVFVLWIGADDGVTNSPDSSMTNVYIVSINDPPTITASVNPGTIVDTAEALPFSIAVGDPDLNESTFTVSLAIVGGSSLGVLSPAGPFTGDAFQVESAVRAVRYTPARNVVSGSQTVQFQFTVSNHGDSAQATTSLIVQEVNDLPNILGVPSTPARINDDQETNLFTTVVIQDVDRSGQQPVSVVVSIDDPVKGELILPDPPASLTDVTPAEATAAIRAIRFRPTPNRIPVDQTESAVFTVTVTDSLGGVRSNNKTTVLVTSVNGAPQILGISATQPLPIVPAAVVQPFAAQEPYTEGISITDDDANLTVRVSMDNTAKGVLTNLGGFVPVGAGVYQIITNPAAATLALSDLQFVVSETYLFPPESPGGTTFTIQAIDSLPNTTTKTLSIVLRDAPQNHLVTRADDDEDPGSLRYAVAHAENNGVITFALAEYPALIRLDPSLGAIVLRRHVTIEGPGADLLTISGDSDGNGTPDTQLFRVSARVLIEGITLTKGAGGAAEEGGMTGGAIYVRPSGSLILRFCAVTESRALQWGGAIDVDRGSLALSHCLVRNNATDVFLGLGGGAISLYTDQPCSFTNTTFSGNQQPSTTGYGGGAVYVENYTPSTDLPVTFTHCTFAENQDASGGGSSISANVFGTRVVVRNSIFADGRALNLDVQGSGMIFSGGGNVSDDSTRTILTQGGQPQAIVLLDQPTDRTNTPAQLLPLDEQFRPTAAYPPSATSPVIGLAVDPSETTDQRGDIRDGDPDSGAIEHNCFQRLVINEIQFDPAAGAPQFVELYVNRDSFPLDLSGYTLRVDGTNRLTFAADTVIQPGHGIIVADATIDAGETPVVSDVLGGGLHLQVRGVVDLTRPDGRPVISAAYNGRFVDESRPTDSSWFANNSITLAPQFRGHAYLPDSVVAAPPLGGAWPDLAGDSPSTSPGSDTANQPFGSPNAYPLALRDEVLLSEDEPLTIHVLDNDLDADGLDLKVIVDVSTVFRDAGESATTTSASGASVQVLPDATPLRGSTILYDPRAAADLQQLAEGARRIDSFWYAIVDIGAGPILGYEDLGAGTTKVTSPAHRLVDGEQIVISGADTAEYNVTATVTRIDDNSFSIPVTFVNDPPVKGSWQTVGTRQPTERSGTDVLVTVLGVNDPPTPVADEFATDEETILRIMADPDFAGTSTAFDTDILYPLPREIASGNLLSNDGDPDTDDDKTTLHVVGVVGAVQPITTFAGTPGSAPVVVTSPNHGLASGATILISGYAGYPSYNGYHTVTVLDADTFSIPVAFVDHNPANTAVWAVLNDVNRLTAQSEQGAAVTLEIRADRTKTCIVYNPRTSAYLNETAAGQTVADSFYYAVEDSHAAITLAKVTVEVSGVNDTPTPVPDPSSLTLLDALLAPGTSLDEVLAQIQPLYVLPPGSGLPGRADAQVQFSDGSTVTPLFLTNLWITDEATPLIILSSDLTQNDIDIDRGDGLIIDSVDSSSRAGAAVSLDGAHASITYNPSTSATLDMLAREELRLDSFDIVVDDGNGGIVTNVVAVLVIGQNDTPVAHDDQAETTEDAALTLNPIDYPPVPDSDKDIDGVAPDNQLKLLQVTDFVTGNGALVNMAGTNLTYDPTVSAYLNGLSHTQSAVETIPYTILDGSFIFANDDSFMVQADGAGFVLDVVANDRNFTGQGGALHIVAVGTPNHLGEVAADASGTHLVYSPEVNFVGDEVFTYTVSDEYGNTDNALVQVRVTVNQLNGNLQANEDHFTVAKGESGVLDVLANDNILPLGANTLTLLNGSSPSAGGQLALVDNRFVYTPDPNQQVLPYHETFQYEISGGGTAHATAVVDVLVVNRENTLNVRDDAFSVLAGSRNNVLDVLLNDNILPGSPAGYVIREVVTNSSFHGVLTINAQGSALTYSPPAGFVGEETFSYRVSDGVGGTGTGTVIIAVGSLATCSDFFAVPYDTAAAAIELDVLANDTVLQGTAGTNIFISQVTPNDPAGMVTIKADGKRLVFNPAAGAPGEFAYTYTIADGSGRTATGQLTLIVVSEGIEANSDSFTVGTGSSGNILDVLRNDAAIPDTGDPLTIVAVGTGLDAPNHGGSVTVNATNDRLIYTPAPGFAGEETFTYTMTDSRRTDTARVAIKVTTGELSANDDVFTVFLEPSASGEPKSFNLPVLANDRVLPDNGQQLAITVTGPAPDQPADAPDLRGSIAVDASATALVYSPRETNSSSYSERFTYEITDGTARRAVAVVEVQVQKRVGAHELETNDDLFSVLSSSQANVLKVLANDAVKPATAASWTIASVTPPAFNGVAVISGTNILYTPQPGFVGTDEFTYSVTDGLGGTGTATVRVKVGNLPLCNDIFTAVSGTTDNPLDVLANDAIRPALSTNYLLLDAGETDRGGTVSVDNGLVLYTPGSASTTYPYTETFRYLVQNNSGGTMTGTVAVTVYQAGSDRASATLTVTVQGENDPPTITGTAPAGTITDKETLLLFPAVTIGEVDNQGQQTLTATVTMPATHGFISQLGGFVETAPGVYEATGTAADLTDALRGMVYNPIENRIPVPTSETTTFTISVTDHVVSEPVVDSATTVTVVAVNDPPIISGTVPGQTVYRFGSIMPFAGVTVTEVDDLTEQPLVVTVSLDDATHGYLAANSLDGFVDLGAGTYQLGTIGDGVTAADATSALRDLVFIPTTDARVATGSPETTRFTITVNDGFAAPVIDTNTTVVALHEFAKKCLADDGALGDNYGTAVAASHSVVVVGAPMDDDRGINSGSAYILTRPSLQSTQWVQAAKLLPTDLAAGDQFGCAVAVSGDTVVVGAKDHKPANASCGAAYVYEWTEASGWTLATTLAPSRQDGANGDEFGCAVAIDEDTIVIGARADDDNGTSSGTAYVYQRNSGTGNWEFVKKLTAADAAGGDEFGISVSISGNTILVGAHLDVNAGGVKTGSAYLFSRDYPSSGNWGQIKKLLPSDGSAYDEFGISVDIDGDTAVVGSYLHDHLGNNTGSAYVFGRDYPTPGSWGELKELLPPTVLQVDEFGYSVSIDRDKAVIGVPLSGIDNQSRYGYAYVYGRNDGAPDNWGLAQSLERTDPGNNDQFGFAVSLGGGVAAVGANLDDDLGNDSGSVYIYYLKFDNAPTLTTSIPDQVATLGTEFELALPSDLFADADVGDSLTITASLADGSALPSWLIFSADPLGFHGTPDATGTYTIRVIATDEDGATGFAEFTLTVVNAGGSVIKLVQQVPLQLTASIDAQTGQLVLSYLRPAGSLNADYTLEFSDQLDVWNPANALIGLQTMKLANGGVEQVVLRINGTETPPERFFRIRHTTD